ncbi:hypothetical protein [Nocardiopsis deserti]|uniref:hypothetical protein n=1 Tax=Nocardiopsis deserti TaxID=2605988 RepID=UPI00123B2C9C|nr:hypothetical protein [Nocardiopsis deserti]
MSEHVDLFGDLIPQPPHPSEEAAPARRRRGPAARLDADVWTALLTCEETATAYRAAIYRRGEDQCWPWCQALSDSGHGKLKAGRAGGGAAAGRTVTAHVYGYQLHHRRLITPTLAVPDPVVAHRCDEPSCQNPGHWELIDRGDNIRAYHQRKHTFPLNDTRTRTGRKSARAEALRDAIRQAQAAHERAQALRERGEAVPDDLQAAADVEAVLRRASEQGRPPEPLPLF